VGTCGASQGPVTPVRGSRTEASVIVVASMREATGVIGHQQQRVTDCTNDIISNKFNIRERLMTTLMPIIQ